MIELYRSVLYAQNNGMISTRVWSNFDVVMVGQPIYVSRAQKIMRGCADAQRAIPRATRIMNNNCSLLLRNIPILSFRNLQCTLRHDFPLRVAIANRDRSISDALKRTQLQLNRLPASRGAVENHVSHPERSIPQHRLSVCAALQPVLQSGKTAHCGHRLPE